MSARTHIPLLLLAVICTLAACRKDPTLPDEGPVGTPLALEFPVWAQDQFPLNIPVDNPLTVEGVALGRRLFYEKALSDDFSMSCASCHQQEHAFSDPRQFSIGTDGSVGRRNSMAVQDLAWDHAFFWDGRASSLEDQAFRPVRDLAEMRNTWPVVVERLQAHAAYPGLFKAAFGTEQIDSVLVVKAIAQFERTLLTFNSPFDRFEHMGDSSALTEQQIRGKDLFFGDAQCWQCHSGPRFNLHGFQNIGLENLNGDAGRMEVTGLRDDNRHFKSVTLRNVAVTGPYMHDGRFATLEEVVNFYAEDVNLEDPTLDTHMLGWTLGLVDLDASERADLVAFLQALTDEEFLANPSFSDPN